MGRAAQRGLEQLTAELEEARRRIAELEAEQAAAAFSSGLVQHLFDGFALLDPKGVHLDVNPALCAMTGFSREELVGVGPPHPYWPPEDHAAIREEFTRDLTGNTRPTALTFMRKNGERFPVMVAHSRVRDERGAVTAMMATIKDMSELMAAQAELADSERRFRHTFDQAPIGAAIVTLDGHFQRVNAAFQRTTGYSEDELTTMTFLDITRPEEREHDAELVGRLLRGDNDELVREKRYVRKDGGNTWGLLSVRVARDDAGKPLYFLSMIVDVDDRRHAQEALQDSEKSLREAQRLARIGNWQWTVATDTVKWSEELFHIDGRDPDLPAPSFAEMSSCYTPESWQRLSAVVAKTLQSGESYELDLEMVRADGTTRHTSARGEATYDAGGKIVGLHGTVQDVTDRKRAEDEIRRLNAELEKRVVSRTAQLAAVTAELEAFAYSASHDLRAPLRTIDGFSAMVMEDAADAIGPEDVRHLQRVREAAQRMGRLIDDLLGLSRVARRDLIREQVDVSALAREVADELRAEHEARAVEVVIAPDMGADADPRLLRVILRNLLDNAWKFSAKHEAARVEVGVTDADGERAFFVRDDGAGFDPEHAEHLFGAFQRLHTAEEFQGNGIGLAMVQRLVNRHGGRAWAEGQVEKGATFFFTLPREK